jgi:hypothetical protein
MRELKSESFSCIKLDSYIFVAALYKYSIHSFIYHLVISATREVNT